jgi:hypothetical protein
VQTLEEAEMWWKPYEPLLEAKSRPAGDVLLDYLARELTDVCEAFPPAPDEIEWQSSRAEARFASQLEHMPRVDANLAALLARIVIWDLQGEIEAIDHLFRNENHREACPTHLHEEALHFLWAFMMEHLLSRQEEAEGKLKRRDLVVVVERFAERFAQKYVRMQTDA